MAHGAERTSIERAAKSPHPPGKAEPETQSDATAVAGAPDRLLASWPAAQLGVTQLLQMDATPRAQAALAIQRQLGNAYMQRLVRGSDSIQRRTVREDYTTAAEVTGPIWRVSLRITGAPEEDSDDLQEFIDACMDGIRGAAGSLPDTASGHTIRVSMAYRRGRQPSDVSSEAWRLARRSVLGRGAAAPTTTPAPAPRRALPSEPLEPRRIGGGTEWYNINVPAENRIQDIVRAAGRDRHNRLELEVQVEPDFIGIANQRATGQVPEGTPEPGGAAVYNAAQRALSMIADTPPTRRRVFAVVLERSGATWQRTSFALVGETLPSSEEPPRPVSQAGDALAGILGTAESAGRSRVRADVIFAPDGVRIASWQASGSRPRAGSAGTAAAGRPISGFRDLAGFVTSSTQYPVIYSMEFELSGASWSTRSWQRIAEIRPAPPPAPGGGSAGPALDEGEMIIQDIRGTHRMILHTAATLIEEQNPARLDNLIFSIAPFAVMGMVRMGRLGRLGNLARLIGRPARRIFGEVEFRGLVQNRPLRELTHHEIYDAFRTTGFTPSNHTIMRLKDVRTANLGVNTLNDVARYMNRGIIQEAGNGLIAIEHQGMQMIVNPETRVLVTFRPQ